MAKARESAPDASDDAVTDAESVPYRALVSDPALVSVFVVSGVSALGNSSIPVALPAVGDAFGLAASEIGLVMGAFALAGTVALPVLSVLADVYGRRRVVLPSLVLFGASGLAAFWVTSFPVLLALRGVQGVAFSGTLPLTPTLTGDLYTGAEGSAAQGIRSGFNGLANAVAPLLAGVLAVASWTYPFALFGLAIPAAAVVYRYYPEPVEPRERDASLRTTLGAYGAAVLAAADARLALLMAGGFTLFFVKGALLTFLPLFVVHRLGSTLTAAGTVLGVYGGTRVVVSPLSGSIVMRLGRRAAILVGVGLLVVGTGAVPFAPSLPLLAVATVVFACGEAVLNPVVNDAVAASAADEQRAGIMSGLQSLKNVALAVAPVLVGALVGRAGFRVAFVLSAALALVYGLVFVARFRPAGRPAGG